MRYEARTGIDLTTVVNGGLVVPPHVVRIWRDGSGRRNTQIIAEYDSRWAARLVAFLLNRLVRFELHGRRN